MSVPTLRPESRSAGRAGVDSLTRPRLGFLGVGWIGRHRMKAIMDSGSAEIVAVAEPVESALLEAVSIASGASAHASLDELLEQDLDGIVIATPSAMHARQSIRALEAGHAVFCQKPLGRTAAEASSVIAAARAADRLLGVDFSYRHTRALALLRDLVAAGEIGDVYTADLEFHNAYGPDKDWFYDPARSGGGCVMDLGIHLVDAAMWTLGFPDVVDVQARLFASGERVSDDRDRCEDYAVASLDLEGGSNVRIACSWNLHAGREAVIRATFYGSRGGLSMRNLNGSFYDFVLERYDGTATRVLVEPPDEWGGRAAVDWATRLGTDTSFDETANEIVRVTEVVDKIYGR